MTSNLGQLLGYSIHVIIRVNCLLLWLGTFWSQIFGQSPSHSEVWVRRIEILYPRTFDTTQWKSFTTTTSNLYRDRLVSKVGLLAPCTDLRPILRHLFYSNTKRSYSIRECYRNFFTLPVFRLFLLRLKIRQW